MSDTYKILVATSCVLVIATALVYLGIPPARVFEHLALTNENNIAAWWSGLLLALIILSAYDGYALLRRDDPSAAIGWAMLAPVFLFLLFSEVGSIHERIGGWGRELSIGAWPPLLALGAMLAWACTWSLARLWNSLSERRAVPWLVAGFCLFGLAAVQEYIEFKLTLESPWAHAIRAALEEGTELLGMLVVLKATWQNTARLRWEYGFTALRELNEPILKIGVVLAVLLTAATAMLTDYYRGQPADCIAMLGFLAAGFMLLQSRSWLDRSMGAVSCLVSLAVVEGISTEALAHYVTQASALSAYWIASLLRAMPVAHVGCRP